MIHPCELKASFEAFFVPFHRMKRIAAHVNQAKLR